MSLTSPSNGAIFTSPAKISLAANAADSDGSVVRVEFFNGGTKLGEDTSAPYTFRWNIGAAGNYTLTARATDNARRNDHQQSGHRHRQEEALTPASGSGVSNHRTSPRIRRLSN